MLVDPLRPDVAAIQEAVEVIHGGGIVAIPTDTLYGLAADPFQAHAVARIFAVKGRPEARPLPLVAADVEQVIDRLGVLSPDARQLASRFWPGPLTIVVAAPSTLAPGVTAGTGTVGVRVPAHEVAQALCRACGTPLTATSANISGSDPTWNPGQVARDLDGRIDLLIDAGPTIGGEPSTIVDATGPLPKCIRAGAIAWEAIEAVLRR